MRGKRWIGMLCAVLSAGTIFSGCGKEGKATSYDASNPVTIRVWTYYNGDQLEAFNNLVETFNTTVGKEKGIYVEGSSQGTVNDLEKNVLDAASGKVGADAVPNIFAAYADTAYAVDKMGMAVDLSDYLTEEEIDAYVDSYIEEGRFSGEKGIKIFPTAKSTELFLLNKTDWDKFAKATGATYEDLSTVEKLVDTAERYYNWTDSQTAAPEDGKALFGRDAVANYFLIGAMQLGTELFHVENGEMTLDFNKETLRKLWDNYYVPLVKGYFTAYGRFRSDEVKMGNSISFVGSSSGATFFPDHVIVNDTESYPIEMVALKCPQFEDGTPFAVQQGAGMVVTQTNENEIQASIEFLKWFTAPEQNVAFSVNSGYLPVMKKSNDMSVIMQNDSDLSDSMKQILEVAVTTINENQLYTPKAFSSGTDARSILENSMTELALSDRETVKNRIQEGQSLSEAAAEFLTDECFDSWYNTTLAQLKELETQSKVD